MSNKIITVRNCGTTSIQYAYVIYRIAEDGTNWYYGATDDVTTASEICAELGSNARIVHSFNCNAVK